jgi:tRNA G18 (ribose-2'-O)-methylase SpoU
MRIIERLSPDQGDAFQKIERKWRIQLERGLFYAEGERVFAALLKSELVISTVLITPELLKKYESRMEGKACDVWVAEKSSIENIAQRGLNQGVLAIAFLPKPLPIETVLKHHPCIVALNGIDHAVNVGSILRNCAAFDVDAVLFDEETVHPFCWRSIKASLGGVFHVSIYATRNLQSFLQVLRRNQFELIAADPGGSISISDLKIASNACLILGSEHRGISPELLALGPAKVSIPMSNVDSLNVAAASAIFLHKISSLLRDGNDG